MYTYTTSSISIALANRTETKPSCCPWVDSFALKFVSRAFGHFDCLDWCFNLWCFTGPQKGNRKRGTHNTL